MRITKSHKSIVLYSVVFTSFVNPFLSASINIALPGIGRQFLMNAVTLSWVAMAFLLSSAVFLVPFGKLSDLYGRKRIFIWGNGIIFITTILCSLSNRGIILIIMRAIQGVGAAMLYATGMAIVTHLFPSRERGKALGINVAAVYLGLSLAPVIGGFLTQTWGWRSIFWVLLPFELTVMILANVFLPKDHEKASLNTFDFKGTFLYMVAVSALMIGFSKIPDLHAIILTIAGTGLLIFFIVIEMRERYPVMEIRLFKGNRIFAFSNLSAFINYATTFAVSFILSLYLQYVKGMSPRDTGILLISQPVLMMLVSTFSGRWSDKYDPRILSSLGMAISVVGLIMLSFITESTSNLFISISLVVLGSGLGLFSSPNTNAIMGSVGKQYLGIASATLGTMRLTGQMMSLGLATLMIHLFIGDAHITPSTHASFVNCVRLLFIIFGVFSFFGIFASLARGKKEKTA
ncbi:MAG: MFS transporter [Bacteroidota bacterium]|nr:MFS transporter [Bacteroidota bacterium]